MEPPTDQHSKEPSRIKSYSMAEEEDISPEDTAEPCMLGFLEKGSRNLLFEDPDCEKWDGGRVGGLPVMRR